MTPGDAEVVRQLEAAGADLSKPHQVQHWVYFVDESAAKQASSNPVLKGFTLDVSEAALGPGWRIRAEHHTALLPRDVEAFRQLFTRLSEDYAAEYDGWEAAVNPKRPEL